MTHMQCRVPAVQDGLKKRSLALVNLRVKENTSDLLTMAKNKHVAFGKQIGVRGGPTRSEKGQVKSATGSLDVAMFWKPNRCMTLRDEFP